MSPTIYYENGYRFFFFSREEIRMHVHVHCENGEAKFWIEPSIELARNYRLSDRQIREVAKIITEHIMAFGYSEMMKNTFYLTKIFHGLRMLSLAKFLRLRKSVRDIYIGQNLILIWGLKRLGALKNILFCPK